MFMPRNYQKNIMSLMQIKEAVGGFPFAAISANHLHSDSEIEVYANCIMIGYDAAKNVFLTLNSSRWNNIKDNTHLLIEPNLIHCYCSYEDVIRSYGCQCSKLKSRIKHDASIK